MNKYIIYAGFAALTLAACDSDESNWQNSLEKGLPVEFAANIFNNVETRMTNNQWEKGDALGIYMLQPGTTNILLETQNSKYVANGGSDLFLPDNKVETIFFPKEGDVEFVGYYPYAQLGENHIYTVNVENQSEPGKIDFLYTEQRAKGNNNDTKVTLNMSHKLSKVKVQLVAGDRVSDEMLKSAKVELTGQQFLADFDVLRNEPSDYLMTQLGKEQIMFKDEGNNQHSAIILPQKGMAGRQLLVTLESGTGFEYSFSGEQSFEKGKQHVFKMTLNRTEEGANAISQMTATILPWNESLPPIEIDGEENDLSDAQTFPKPNWKINDPGRFFSTMTCIVALDPAAHVVPTEEDEIAVFYGDDCRGVGKLIDGNYYITVNGDGEETENMMIKFYDADRKHMYVTEAYLTFIADRIYGSHEHPEIVPIELVTKQ